MGTESGNRRGILSLLCLEVLRCINSIIKLYKTLKLPINNPSKPESQKILHAIEELYFLRRYEEALTFAELALKGVLLGEFRSVLERYKVRCVVKKEKTGSEQAE